MSWIIQEENIGKDISIVMIDIEKIDSDIEKMLNSKFVIICEGMSDTDLNISKKRVKNFLYTKSKDIKMGAIAEFFVHLFLNSINYKQECFFLNMEENSIKKGFDGYYSLNNKEWIMESKSGSIKTKNITHAKKIKEAYDDLSAKFAGNVKNDPWKNAYMHAGHQDIDADKSITQRLKEYSNNFVEGVYSDSKQFRIIPCATIFMEGDWKTFNKNDLKVKLVKGVSDYNYKKMKVICLTQKSINLFLEYLDK